MHNFAPSFGPKLTGLLFWVLEKVYSQDARTNFDAKYAKRRGSTQGCAWLTFYCDVQNLAENWSPARDVNDRDIDNFEFSS